MSTTLNLLDKGYLKKYLEFLIVSDASSKAVILETMVCTIENIKVIVLTSRYFH